ncbi:MAG: hypothetical protein PHV03_03065 [Desulfitobacteriaceae bacterium]|nr:hypothetical protein [Desulfitobacteriaceae bacterium]
MNFRHVPTIEPAVCPVIELETLLVAGLETESINLLLLEISPKTIFIKDYTIWPSP